MVGVADRELALLGLDAVVIPDVDVDVEPVARWALDGLDDEAVDADAEPVA